MPAMHPGVNAKIQEVFLMFIFCFIREPNQVTDKQNPALM